MDDPARARPRPCATCPYRRDVASGVWDAEEYAKLPGYDGDTWAQTPGWFGCHGDEGVSVCSGWLGYRDPTELLAVRLGVVSGALDPSVLDYATDVELFASGAEAAAHGMAAIEAPGDDAAEAIRKITAARAARKRHPNGGV